MGKIETRIKKLGHLFLLLTYLSVGSFSQTVNVRHSTYVFDCSFLPPKKSESGAQQKQLTAKNPRHVIIQSNAELIEFTKCDVNYKFDFDKHILIGVDGQTSGCAPGFCLFEVLKF